MSDLKVNTRMLGLGSINVHVDDYGGDGRPVVLVHGWPLSGESWSEQIGVLREAGLRVVTYDRRGFGRSDKPGSGYDYDTLAEDLSGLLENLDLREVSLVGFSMGGGEVARYIAAHGEGRLHSVVLAASVTPMMLQSSDNPAGPLEESKAADMSAQLTENQDAFYDQFTREFFSPDGDGNVLVAESQRQDAVRLCHQADKSAALEALQSFGTTDFRGDLATITVPTLVVHGDADGVVPFAGSGQRTHRAVAHSELVLVPGAPHGLNVSHATEFNRALVDFLTR